MEGCTPGEVELEWTYQFPADFSSACRVSDVVKMTIFKVEPVKLGGSANLSNFVVGGVYVPSKWGGDLKLSGSNVELFYTDGSDLDCDRAINILKGEFDASRVAQGSPCSYTVPENKHKFYYIKIQTAGATVISTTFQQEKCFARMTDSEPSNDVWNSWWWPKDDGIDPNMYDATVTYATPPGAEDGPLKKYDDYVDEEEPDVDSARIWEWNNIRHPAGTGGIAGMCDATSWAGLEMSRPSGNKTLQDPGNKNIVFREQDRLGLCAERYWVGTGGELNVDEPGTARHLFRKVDPYLKADWFHNKLRDRISANQGVMVYVPNWNAGVYKYKAAFVADGTTDAERRRVTIENEMTHKDWAKWVGQTETFSTIYRVEYAADGTLPTDGSGELSWTAGGKPTKVYYKKPTAPIINPKIDKVTLGEIYQ